MTVFFGFLVLVLNCCCRNIVKYRPLSKGLFQRKQEHGGGKDIRVARNFYQQCLSVTKWNKKYSLKQVVPITNTTEKRFFATSTFEGLYVVTFQTEKENLYLLWSVYVLFTFSENIFSFDVVNFQFILK